jgi:hypothetical protein
MSSTSTASKPSQSTNTNIPQTSPTEQSKLSAASPQAASRTRPTHSATHIRQRSIELKDIVTSSPTARRMSMSSTPQDVTDRGEGVVARSLRYAEWVIAGLCAWSLLYVPALLAMVTRTDQQQDWNTLLVGLWYCSINLDCITPNFHILFRKPT